MSAMTDYLEDALLGRVLNGTALSALSGTVYLALFSGATTDALTSGGAAQGELAGNGYARAAVVSGFTISGGVASNTADVSFAAATGAWADATHAAIFDALTGGNALLHGALSGTVTGIVVNDIAIFEAGQFSVTFL